MIRTLCAAVLVTACSLSAPAPAFAADPSPRPKSSSSPAAPDGDCAPATAPPPESAPPTSVNTLRQAYFCVLDNYYGGPALDSRELLKNALAAYTQDLMRRGADRADLQLPALTGGRDTD
ncbi:hypothetical protein [Streptosporangium sp. H16]|uniref:hypothetical protein n=1 Tax=Streptosporangium sp. H16 TaxID=3444184 RepID=UPI003F792CD8